MWSKITNALKSHTPNKPQPTIPEDPSLFLDRLNQFHNPSSSMSASIKHFSMNLKSSRPTVGEIFSPLNIDNSGGSADNLDVSLSLSNPILPGPDSFYVSRQLDISSFQLSGLDFDVNAPTFSLDSNAPNQLLSDGENNYQMTSKSYQPKDPKGKEMAIQTMLRSSSSQPRRLEADINDESTTGIVVYSGGTSEPDPFSAYANTYYTPQTMIPATPPKDTLKRVRKTSKEESLIISLQTQLALQTELCGHYEADLKTRDELVEILGKKLANSEKDGTKRKDGLRSWKKKAQELERVCRQLEETVEGSMQESMERSVIDEASSEALRMLHGQIASLQREKNEWSKREQGLRESENKRNELETELQEVRNLKDALEKERDELKDAFQQAQEQAVHLGHDLQERDNRVSELEQERRFTNDNVTRLEENLRARDAEMLQVTCRVLERESEVENLHEEMSTMKREHSHLINEQTRVLRDATCQEDERKARVDQLVRAKAEADVEIKTSRDRVIVLKEEVELLRRHVHSLQQENADKEIKIVEMTKQYSLNKDLQGLNIALDSKQQELGFLKRKTNVKGTAGSTPAQPSKVSHRHDSSIFTAIPVLSRPPSVLSDSGADAMHIPKKERIISCEMAPPSAKLLVLGKSTRVNGSGTSSVSSSANRSVVCAGIDGSIMGPLPLKSRPSIVGTPTPASLSLSQSSSTRPTFHHRVSSVNSEHKVKTKLSRTAVNAGPPGVLEQDEKENVDYASSRRRSMIPTLA